MFGECWVGVNDVFSQGIDTVVHAAGVLQDGLILPNLPKARKPVGKWDLTEKTANIYHPGN